MPVTLYPFRKAEFSLPTNKYINTELIAIIRQNDKKIHKNYLKKSSVSKCRRLPVVTKSVKSGLLVELSGNYQFSAANVSSNKPIPIACNGNKCYYYKLPAGKQFHNIIKSKLFAEIFKFRRNRNGLLIDNSSDENNKKEYRYFQSIRNEYNRNQEEFLAFPNSGIRFRKSDVRHSMNLSKSMDESTFLMKPFRDLTTETELLPESFFKKPSSLASSYKYPAFRTYLEHDTEWNHFAVSPIEERHLKSQSTSKVKSTLNSLEVNNDVTLNKELVKAEPKKILFPIVPNYTTYNSKYNGGNIMYDEDSTFILSILYTESKIKEFSKPLERTFSGTVYVNYSGQTHKHGFYCGNFGFVDGISSFLFKNIVIPKGSKEEDQILETLPISRESFLALSHMFNLDKLVGKPNVPMMDLISQRTASDNSITCSVYDNIHLSRAETESVESVDFTLINKFTERLVQDVRKVEKSKTHRVSHEKATDSFQYVVNKVLTFYKTYKRKSSKKHSLKCLFAGTEVGNTENGMVSISSSTSKENMLSDSSKNRKASCDSITFSKRKK